MTKFKKLLSGALVALMAAQTAVPIFAYSPKYAAYMQENGTIVMTDPAGNAVVVDESWEETYPTGTFAFSTTQVNIAENGETGSMTLHRLGGSSGRAIARVDLIPGTALIDDDKMSYAYAAGRDDYYVEVENPSLSALTDPLGGAPELYESGTDVYDSALSKAEIERLGLTDPKVDYCFRLRNVPTATDYQWQIRLISNGSYGEWTDIEGANDELFPAPEQVMEDIGFSDYDLRCIYTVDGVRYCSNSAIEGEVYVKPDKYEMEGWEELAAQYEASINAGQEFSRIIFEGNEYDNYSIYVVFAEGEDEKEIRFTAIDDELHETDETVNLIITEAYGAELYDSANIAAVVVHDDEPELPSAMGFETNEIWADMSLGSVRIPLIRTVDDPEALVYITGVDYTVEAGSALPGRNYAAVEDQTAYFPADFERSAIDITLINDGKLLSKEDSDLCFTVRLTMAKGGGTSTLIEGRDEITVRLYNSGEGNASNIASRIYSEDEVDVTLDVDEAAPIVSAAEEILAAPADGSDEVAVADYTLSNEEDASRKIDYKKLKFVDSTGNSIANKDEYWKAHWMPYNSNSKFETDNGNALGSTISWSGGEADGNGWKISNKKGGEIFGSIENMYKLYENIEFHINGTASKNMSDYSKLGFKLDQDSDVYSIKEPSKKLGDTGYESSVSNHILRSTTESYDGIGLVCSYHNTALIEYNATATITLEALRLERRTFGMPNVALYTADDDKIYSSGTVKDQELYSGLKPSLTMDAGKGGVTADGNSLYVGSEIKIAAGTAASSTYSFAKTSNGSLSNAANLYSTSRLTKLKEATVSGSTATLSTLFDDPQYCSDQTEIRVYMDRNQTITLDITNSVERKKDEDGNITQAADTTKISDAATKLKNKINANGGYVTYKYKEIDSNYNFVEKTGRISLNGFNALTYMSQSIKNLQSVNFHLPETDVILLDGEAYKGNDDIPIPVSMFLNGNVTFLYYDEDFVNVESIMSTSIARIECYVDMDNDGKISGTYNKDNGVFTTTPGRDKLMSTISTQLDSISISSLAPQYVPTRDGYRQVILKVYYTMNPRCLMVTEGHSESDTAEIVPAIVTSITDVKSKNALSSEQQGYRYIDHEGTGDGQLMFGAAATKTNYVDITLGGDFNPAYIAADGKTTVWEPSWSGNPYPGAEFTDPEPITLDGTALGDGYSVGEVDMASSTIALTGDGKSKVAAYLSSMHENDRIALCVREAVETKSRGTDAPTHYLEGIESSTLSKFYTYPSTTGVRNMSDPYAGQGEPGFDMEESSNPMDEYNMDGEITMPELSIGLSDYVTIAINGQELSMTVGAKLAGFTAESEKNSTDFKDPETNSVVSEGKDNLDKVKQIYNSILGRDSGTVGEEARKQFDELRKDAAHSYRDGQKAIKSMGFEGGLSFSMTMVLKWNPLENKFFFNQMMFLIAGELKFTFTARLTPIPIFYVSITVGIGVELATGLERQRVKERGETVDLTGNSSVDGVIFSNATEKSYWTHYEDQNHMGQDALDAPEGRDFMVGTVGSQMKYTTKAKAIDVYFSGTLSIDAKDADGNRPSGFTPGVIKSTGDEAVTVKLASAVDGKDNSKAYTVTFTVVESKEPVTKYYEVHNSGETTMLALPENATILDNITEVKKMTDDVYFAGFNLSPSLFMEVAVGVGIELFKVELFINIKVSAAFGFITHDSPEYADEGSETTGAVVNEFSFTAGVGIRVTALFFNFEFNAVQFAITYDRDAKFDETSGSKSGWNFKWYAANQEVGGKSRAAADDDPFEVRIILPDVYSGQETLYTPEDNAENSLGRAFDPTDDSVPFQYSGYGSSGDAFTLGESLLPGSTYELVTVGDTNYVVYTVSRTTATSSIDVPMLVMSKVQETASDDDTTLGLAHPFDSTSAAPYMVLDADDTGDLDFSVWADGTDLRVAWVSYTTAAATAYDAATGDTVDALCAAAACTVVKTVTVDTAKTTSTEALGTVTQVSPTPAEGTTHGIYSTPSGAGDMIFYSEAIPYTADELTALMNEYKTYLGTPTKTTTKVDGVDVTYGDTDPTVEFRLAQKKLQAAVYGKSFYPSFAYKNADGTYTNVQVEATDWTTNEVNIENAALVEIGDTYYAAYTTAQYDLIDATITTTEGTKQQTQEEVIRKLYLQKVSVTTTTTTDEAGTTTTTTTITPDSAIALRKLCENREDSSKDGVYRASALFEKYEDPYFANVKFLKGKLGNLDSASPETYEDVVTVTARAAGEGEAVPFLLFEMNGNTYIVPQDDILSITGEAKSGSIIPFFTRKTSGTVNGDGDNVAMNVTIGADPQGNIAAVYTASVENTSNTAVYLTKYDSVSGTWGAGTMLAMHDMQVYEDSVSEGWDPETTREAYFEKDTNGDVYNFTFGELTIGLGSGDKLLVLAEGSKMLLEEQTQYKPVYGTGGSVTIETDGTTFMPATAKDGSGYDVSNGMYAMTFGSGVASLGYASIHLSNYDFTPASEMSAYVSFTNMGDTAIRASEADPATIELCLEGASAALKTWQVKETIRAGQSVSTTTESVTLPAELTYGKKLYFRVYEDTTYITGTAFDKNTLTASGEADTAACITLEKRVELGYESDSMTPYLTVISADENNVTLQANIHVGNRGALDAAKTYLRFCYEDVQNVGDEANETLVINPIDLTGHKLSVSDQTALSRAATDKTLANGYLLLATTENGVAVGSDNGSLKSMYGRTVTGTFTVPKSYFDTDYGTHSLNIRLSLEGYDADGDLYEEYDSSNNIAFVAVEQKTFFETANNINMQVGSYLRIPLVMQTTRQTAPSIVVSEITDDGERNLATLYYSAAQSAIIMRPAKEGEGKIRVEDVNTNSVYDICYKILGEGLALNIYNDNGFFTWLDSSGNAGDSGLNAWRFKDNIMRWSDGKMDAPLRNDLAVADPGESFRFYTLAESIDLYFMGEGDSEGKIKVSSSLENYSTTTYTSADGTKAVRIDFDNALGQAHTVTITAVDKIVRFDKMVENFPADYVVKSDPTSPDLYYDRTLPDQGSLVSGENFKFGVYFVDIGGLSSVTVNGEDITSKVTKVNGSDELWFYEITTSQNTGYSFVVVDKSGNTTTRTLTAEWFMDTVEDENKDPGAADINVNVIDAYGVPVFGKLDETASYRIQVTDNSASPISDARISYIPFGEDSTHLFIPCGATDVFGNMTLTTGKGIYRVEYTPTGSTVTRTRMLRIDIGSTSYPYVIFAYDAAQKQLKYSVKVVNTGTIDDVVESSPIKSLKLDDGTELKPTGLSPLYLEGTIDCEASGKYTLTAVCENGKTATGEVTVDEMPIELKGAILTYQMVTETDGAVNDDGSITIDESNIIGGKRNGTTTRADYEYQLVKEGSDPTDDGWTDDTTFGDLAVGDYELHIRDKNDPQNTRKLSVKIGFESIRINSVSSTPTEYLGHTGSITVDAEGGYSTLDYSYVPVNAVIDNKGTLDDSDDTVTYDGVTYPLWTDSSVMNDLPEGTYTVTVRETGTPANLASAQIAVPHVVTIHGISTVPATKNNNDGQIIVNATGGYGDLEYSFVPTDAVIDDNGTPDDDSDDTVTYKGVTYPLWTKDSSIGGLPVGKYDVTVRDSAGTTSASMNQLDVPDHMMVRIETFPTYEDESTGWITVFALGGYGEFEYCYIPLDENGGLREDAVIGTAVDEDGKEYVTLTFDGRESAPLWTESFRFTGLPKGDYLVIVRDTEDPENPRYYPEIDELLKMEDNQYTAVNKVHIRNHDKFEITVKGDDGAIVSPEGVTLVQRYRGLTVYFEPKAGYQFEAVIIDGHRMNVYGSYTFTNVNEPHSVEVITKQLETIPFKVHELNVTSTKGGSVSDEGTLLAAYGSSRVLKIKADDGWRIADVLVDGKSVGAVSSYEFRAITESHTLHAVFEKLEDTVAP